jgi:anti-sigma regulatory factor (Ser/Thr protein kinase)
MWKKNKGSKRVKMVSYSKSTNTIKFGNQVNSYIVGDFCSALNSYFSSKEKTLIVDFSFVERAYPIGMLGVISTVNDLISLGHNVSIVLPENINVANLFKNGNWAYFLSPNQFRISESFHDRHLVTRQFANNKEQFAVVNDFMDVVLRNIEMPKDIISGLEWSINEITDNVLNHSNSRNGGFVQVSTYPKMGKINFAVCDSGRGILKSLKEGIPSLRKDHDAIGEAIKAGVTRNPKFGQGNGLAGSLRVTTMSGGSFEITSGAGRLIATADQSRKVQRYPDQYYHGTLVNGQINISSDFSITKALDFGYAHPYVSVNIIDTQYEMDDSDCLLLAMKKETTGYGSRNAGKQMRTKIMNFISSKPDYPIVVDWTGIPVISSSFADEFMGKLFLEIGAMSFSAKIRNKGMEELIKNLLDKAISQRLVQATDEEALNM